MSFDKNDPADLLALKNEINIDPNAYGYVPEDTNLVLDILALKRTEITVSRPTLQAVEIISVAYFAAYNGLAIDEQEWLRWITSIETIQVTQDVRDRFTGVLGGSLTGDSIWSAGTDDTMEPIMIALIDIDGSRAEELFGFGTVINRDDWFAARDS